MTPQGENMSRSGSRLVGSRCRGVLEAAKVHDHHITPRGDDPERRIFRANPPYLDVQRLSRNHRAGETHVEPAEPRGIIAAQAPDESPARHAVPAESVEDR